MRIKWISAAVFIVIWLFTLYIFIMSQAFAFDHDAHSSMDILSLNKKLSQDLTSENKYY